MKHLRIFTFLACLVFALSLFVGCDDSKSSVIISAGDMEDILYDYHLAEAMAQQSKEGYAKTVLEYRAAVLRKYGVSQEKFDTSMVYYMRHTDELHTMYEHIADRMQEEARNIGADATGGSASAMGDSVDVWKGERALTLIPNQPYNLYSFDLKTDTTFHKGDHIVLAFKANFIFQDGMRDGVAMLAVVFNNDSTASRVTHLSSSMTVNLQLDDNDSLGVKQIKGFFMLAKNNDMNASSTTLQLMSINNIFLLRIHSKEKPLRPIQSNIPINRAAPDSERLKPQVAR